DAIPPTSMSPRIYEAIACGALVISDRRAEIEKIVPEMPTFETASDLIRLVRRFLRHPEKLETIRATCAQRLSGATYAKRLMTVIDAVSTRQDSEACVMFSYHGTTPVTESQEAALGPLWESHGDFECLATPEGVVLRKEWDSASGSERGF